MIPVKQLTTQQKIDIAIELRDTPSFFKKYYELLPRFKTQKDCFEYLSQIYTDIFKTNKYSNYDSFRVVICRDAKKHLRK